MTTIPDTAVSCNRRVHIVLIPGFGGFDALGRIEYYTGTTERLQRWLAAGGSRGQAVVLHYFDDLPTAAVATRAERLRAYLAKRIARREIEDGDSIALVGHSTGGLDIRRLLFPKGRPPELHVDGGAAVGARTRATAMYVDHPTILNKVTRVVFISVPQYGTNIADWVRGHAPLRRVVIADLGWGIRRRRGPEVLSSLLCQLGRLAREPDLVLAACDALNETRASRKEPIRRANAEEAASQLRLWVQLMVDDFAVIDDLASFTNPQKNSASPAHYSEVDRRDERDQWQKYGIQTMSIATVGRRAFKFKAGELAAPFDFRNPRTWPTEQLVDDAGQMDISYLLTNRACAGGSFRIRNSTFPTSLVELSEDIANLNSSLFDDAKLGPCGPKPGEALEVWDNDGIVTTASMLWPNGGETRLVAADHLDIVGHYVLRKTIPSPDASGRRYTSVDALKSHTEFAQDEFDQVWKDVFDFCVS
ncbi:MAG TPA: hypothetical protein VEF89_14445 [Solirubrobacteraceae bacterium]|nr:hypothetical protein [Solirubrobacteraceae bacterium]